MPKLILLSGPACVGKGPLVEALKHYNREIRFGSIPVKKSIESRLKPGQTNPFTFRDHSELTSAQTEELKGLLRPTDDHLDFYPAATIEGWSAKPKKYVVGPCRGFPQGIRRTDLDSALKGNHTIFSEVYYTLGRQFIESPMMADVGNVRVHTVFLSPLSVEEMEEIKASKVDLNQYITSLMMNKQMKRARFLGQAANLKDFTSRASDLIEQLPYFDKFNSIIVNHDGEGDPNWNQVRDGKSVQFDPHGRLSGDAARASEAFRNIFLAPDAD